MIAGYGCVAGETLIDGIPIKDRARMGQVTTIFGKAIASPAYLKGKADLYEVRTVSGKSILATKEHRFLTPTGWQELKHLSPDSLIAVDGSYCETQYQGKATDSSIADLSESRPCDELPTPHQVALAEYSQRSSSPNTYQNLFPCWMQSSLCVEGFPRQTEHHAFLVLHDLIENSALYPHELHTVLPYPYSQDDCLDTHSGYSLQTVGSIQAQFPAQHKHFHLAEFSEGYSDPLYIYGLDKRLNSHFANQSQSPALDRHQPSLQFEQKYLYRDRVTSEKPYTHIYQAIERSPGKTFSFQFSTSPSHQFQVQSLSSSLNLKAYKVKDTSLSIIWEKIEDITFNRHDDFYDIHVPFHEHYLAHGFVNHNSGKTYLLARKALYMAWLNAIPTTKGAIGALYEPTADMITELLIPELEGVLEDSRLPYTARYSSPIRYVIDFPHGRTTILLKSFENWKRIVGSNMAFAGVDEVDTVPKAIAHKSWKKLMGRVRVGKVNQIFTTSTPEGFQFAYEFFERDAKDDEGNDKGDRKIIRACTLDNPFLSDGYIKRLYENYPPNLINAYIFGKFTNLETGSVYHQFDRVLNATSETVKDGEPLHIGMDFNIGRMAAIIHVLRDGLPRAVDEICHWYDTPSMIEEICDRYPDHHISIYPDASGKARDTNGSKSDFELLKQAGFEIIVNSTNPSVKDRIVTMNAAFCNALGERRYKVNVDKCPIYTTVLQQQALKNGVPVKDGTEDPADAGAYCLVKLLPIKHEEPYSSSFT